MSQVLHTRSVFHVLNQLLQTEMLHVPSVAFKPRFANNKSAFFVGEAIGRAASDRGVCAGREEAEDGLQISRKL